MFAKIGPTPAEYGGIRGPTIGVVKTACESSTPPPTSPKIPRPKVVGESSESLKETPVARLDATPLSLRETPYREVAGSPGAIEFAGAVAVK